MKQIKSLFVGICVSVVLFAAAEAGFSQAAQPNYEATLQMVVGSNDGSARGSLPTGFRSLTQQLGERFGFSNYRLAGTMVARLANASEFENRSISSMFSPNPESRSATFLEWTMKGLRPAPGVKGNQFAIDSLRFGARVPVPVATLRDQSGKDQPVINYEQIGVTLKTLAVPENTPTLVATLNLPGGTDTIFLVMTVRPVEF
jgi:hypothetical protein